MSTDVTVYGRGDSAKILAAAVRWLGMEPSSAAPASEPFELFREMLGLDVFLEAAHDLVNDLGIPFEEYPVAIMFKRWASAGAPEFHEKLCEYLALCLSYRLATDLDIQTIVVRDSQRLLARNGERVSA